VRGSAAACGQNNGTWCRKEDLEGGGVPKTTEARVGRRPRTSRAELERVALRLFEERGFDETTVDDIAAAAGIGRRTFFRYYDSKNDVVWGDFEHELDRLRAWLLARPPEIPMMDALREAVVAFNRLDPAQTRWHRLRMTLILQTPALQAHSTLRYADWRAVVAEFVARRLGQPDEAITPQVVAYTSLGAALAAYEHWLRHDGTDLSELLDASMRALSHGFQDLG
jgi:mycofactocin system transcriptional regulator